MYSTGQLREPGGDSHHLMSRRRPVYTRGKDKYLERGVETEGQRCPVSIRVKCGSTIPAEEGNDKEVHRGVKNPKPGLSPEVSLHAFIVENLDISRQAVDTLRRTKVSQRMSNPERFLRKRAHMLLLQEAEILFICEQASTNLASEECTWVIDSGVSFHITPSRECFSTYITGNHGSIMMGNNEECKIVGVGNVCLTTSTGCRLILKDVRHTLDIRLNLI